jgi:hypothetical protein
MPAVVRAWVRVWARAEEEVVVEALVREEAAARVPEADPVLAAAVVRAWEEEVRDNEDMCSHYGRERHGGGHLPALRAGSYIYYDRSG